jgi:death-on-curing protein
MVLLAPTAFAIKTIHDIFMKQYGCTGYMCEGMVEGCMERAMTYVYKYQPFPKLFLKAGATLYSFIVFHPFVDGNKRTAYETTRIFLRMNGYELRVPYKEAVKFTRAIADGTIDDVETIALWLQKHSRRNIIYSIQSYITKSTLMSYRDFPKSRVHLLPKETLVLVEVAMLYPE